MKKGCFITSIALLTIIVGAALYVIQNHFDSLVLSPAKKVIANLIRNDLYKELDKVVESEEKTELKKKIKDFSQNKAVLNRIKEEEITELVNAIEKAISDSLISKAELNEISKLMESK